MKHIFIHDPVIRYVFYSAAKKVIIEPTIIIFFSHVFYKAWKGFKIPTPFLPPPEKAVVLSRVEKWVVAVKNMSYPVIAYIRNIIKQKVFIKRCLVMVIILVILRIWSHTKETKQKSGLVD
jgi:hypothetical protein